MSDQQSEPQAIPAPAVAPAAPAAPAPSNESEPDWLPGRLKQAKESAQKKLLSEFGVTDPGELKSRLQELDKLKTAQLSEQERIEKQLADLRPKAERASKLEELVSSMVEAQFAALPEAQQAAIDAVANGDPGERWKLINVIRAATGAAPTAASVAIPQAPKLANTAPAAPPPPAPAQPQTPYDRYEALLRGSDPQAAYLFKRLNRLAIERSQPKG